MSGGSDDRFVVPYRFILNADWTVREFRSQIVGQTANKLFLRRDSAGRWNDGVQELAELTGAVDVDLSISPFTNTLPIRRLKLSPGQSADISVAYVAYPDHSVMKDPQRYTCLASGRYLFESVDSDFKSEILVDDRGLVTTYPDLFARI